MTNTLPDNLYLTDKHKVYENKICSSENYHSGAYASIVILIQDSYFALSERLAYSTQSVVKITFIINCQNRKTSGNVQTRYAELPTIHHICHDSYIHVP